MTIKFPIYIKNKNQNIFNIEKFTFFELVSALEYSGILQHSANFAKKLDHVLPLVLSHRILHMILRITYSYACSVSAIR
ncbi:hypothetical protein D1BOALGB6SA_3501 [Olavius sp. associated proteobacterium Delta 1]|nr:hypothetical protein D1BOALGB6SA_3501 [Olavius sp. associated proteobacterium Delta 1]CAD7842731.1 MAG: hypothetical protein [Olavius algarvensis spirochete endosymbiont]